MNRSLWFQVLQVAVVAPYIYSLSSKANNDYFNVGLKLVAGSIIMLNLKPLLVQAAPLIASLANATAQASKVSILSDAEKAGAVDVEFVNKVAK